MLAKLNHLALSTVIGVAALMGDVGIGNALPRTTGLQTTPTEIVPVQYMQNHTMSGQRMWLSRRDGNRCRTRFGNCRHYYQGFFYETPWWTFPLIVGSLASGNYGGSHVRWCLAHYRSYNPRTDMWLGYSGTYYRCRSRY